MKRVGFSPPTLLVWKLAPLPWCFDAACHGSDCLCDGDFSCNTLRRNYCCCDLSFNFFYLGLFLQIDAYAARNGLKGLPKAELPPLVEVFEGWYFIAVFVALIVMLLYMQQEVQAPYYATATLLLINQISKKPLEVRKPSEFFTWHRFIVC